MKRYKARIMYHEGAGQDVYLCSDVDNAQPNVCNQDGFPIEAVKHLSRCACNCQTCRADVTHNRHVASCMVGKAQEYLEEHVIEKTLYGGPITHD